MSLARRILQTQTETRIRSRLGSLPSRGDGHGDDHPSSLSLHTGRCPVLSVRVRGHWFRTLLVSRSHHVLHQWAVFPAQARATWNEVDVMLSEMALRLARVEECRWSTVFWVLLSASQTQQRECQQPRSRTLFSGKPNGFCTTDVSS